MKRKRNWLLLILLLLAGCVPPVVEPPAPPVLTPRQRQKAHQDYRESQGPVSPETEHSGRIYVGAE